MATVKCLACGSAARVIEQQLVEGLWVERYDCTACFCRGMIAYGKGERPPERGKKVGERL